MGYREKKAKKDRIKDTGDRIQEKNKEKEPEIPKSYPQYAILTTQYALRTKDAVSRRLF